MPPTVGIFNLGQEQMESDCILHVKIGRSGAVTFTAVVSRNDALCINHI